MIFINNKYTNIYFNIIKSAQIRDPLSGYSERHHIIPKCLGGSNKKDNLVILTAREHFVCHHLLTKMVNSTREKFQLSKAFNCMLYMTSPVQDRYKVSSRKFESFKKNYSKMFSEQQRGDKNHMYGKTHTPETLAKIAIARANSNYVITDEIRAKLSAANKGKNVSAETRAKISKANKGRLAGKNNPMYGNTHTAESRKKISEKAQGRTPWNLGVTHTDEVKQKMSTLALQRTKYKCEHCGVECVKCNYNRWHGDNCRSIVR